MSGIVIPAPPVITPWHNESIGLALAAAAQTLLPSTASAVWPAVNLALYFPFTLTDGAICYSLAFMVGATQNGNIDLGIYTKDGGKVVSSGSTAMGAINTLQVIDIADIALAAGEYYLAAASDSGTGTVQRNATGLPVTRISGVCQQASAFPLPATATFAAGVNAIVPAIAAFLHPSV